MTRHFPKHAILLPWRSWTTRLPTEQKIPGSNPGGGVECVERVKTVHFSLAGVVVTWELAMLSP